MKKKTQSSRSRVTETQHKSNLLLLIVLALVAVTLVFATEQIQPAKNRPVTTPTPVQKKVTAQLSLLPDSTASSPLTEIVNNNFTVELRIDPRQHKVSVVTPVIMYDPQVLKVVSVEINPQDFPALIQKVTTQSGKITFSAGINLPLDNAITQPTTVATITFQGIKSAATRIDVDGSSSAYSLSAQDGPSLNVVAKRTPAFVTISQ